MQITPLKLVLCFAVLSASESSSLRHVQVTSHVKNVKSHIKHDQHREDAITGESEDAHVRSQARASAEEAASAFTDLTLGSMITAMLRGEGPRLHDVIKAAEGKITTHDAMRRLQGKLPTDVAAIMLAHNNGTAPPARFTEPSLLKALNILNGLVEEAWKRLDDEIIRCKEFEDRNRGTFDQVMTDLARLGEQIADLERQRSEANEGLAMKDEQTKTVQFNLQTETQLYWALFMTNNQELTIRKNDLAVFHFIMDITKCDATSMVQVGNTISASPAGVRVCPASAGGLELRFNDPKLQAEAERRMTPGARKAIREMLERANGQTSLLSTNGSLLQRRRANPTETEEEEDADLTEPDDDIRGDVPEALEEKKPGLALAAQKYLPATPVKTAPNPEGQWKKCVDGTPNCGLLHDNLSLHWGKFKDLVDELQAEMDKNAGDWKTLKANFNAQLMVIRIARARLSMMLAEVISNLNADREETIEKEQQRATLDKEYFGEMKKCKRTIEEILFTDMCGVRRVRNEVMTYSTDIPTDSIKDCDVSDWVPDDCSVECDDKCPPPKNNPYACGGWTTLRREIVDFNNTHGIECPDLTRPKKCNQQKCEVDCLMSDWSGWGACTKECESGVRSRTRSIITKPKNGGKSCDNVQETNSCNTGSCDRDCTLHEWTTWSPCSMACSGGVQERIRKVDVPTRGRAGECPKTDSGFRLNEQACNVQDCVGDEICIADQDLIIAIDGSGSLREEGFKTLRDFAADLMDRYQSQYYGEGKMKVGVIQFGNGEVFSNGTVSPAIQVYKLTDKLDEVKTSISALTWQKGFTNMAQAFTLANTMFQRGGRPSAQSAVAVITDGKPSFLWQTSQQIQKLKDQHVKLFFAPVTENQGAELALMKKWASQPWETHLVHIPGLLALGADSSVFAEKIIATFCPKAMSPSAKATEEKKIGFMLVREQGRCGDQGELLSETAATAADCAALASNAGFKAFGFTSEIWAWYAQSIYPEGMRAATRCYAEKYQVDEAQFQTWAGDRKSPACPDGNGWKLDYFSDFYALEPVGA